MLTLRAPAKVNWYLEVTGKRPDGFHEVETVMQSLDPCDTLHFEDLPQPRLDLSCNIDLGPVQENLAWRAAALLQRLHAPGRGARISLEKRIPHGAGLGGGSSDASNTLVALNRLWGLGLSPDRLREIAAQLGSDCPFFVEGGLALCTGRGEKVLQLAEMAVYNLVILYPGEVCPTREVYADLAMHGAYGTTSGDLKHEFTDRLDALSLANLIHNRLQDSALRVSSGLRSAWEQTGNVQDVVMRFVSGSGSSIVFLVRDGAAAKRIVDSVHFSQLGQSFAARTLAKGTIWG